MKSFKNHIGVIFPLVILLFSIEFILLTDKVIKNYESLMGNDYNIIIMSDKSLSAAEVKNEVNTFKELILLDTTQIINKLKENISQKNISVLMTTLPKFYSLKLNNFPSSSYMQKVTDNLKKIDGVKRVETFSKTYDKIYKMLVLSRSIFAGFTVLIAFMGIALVFKQMKIWLYEHKSRVEIMTLFGAPYWLKSAILYKIAIIDSLIATALISLFYLIAPQMVRETFLAIGFELPNLDPFSDIAILLASSIAVSIVSVTLVMIRSKAD